MSVFILTKPYTKWVYLVVEFPDEPLFLSTGYGQLSGTFVSVPLNDRRSGQRTTRQGQTRGLDLRLLPQFVQVYLGQKRKRGGGG